MIWCLVFFVGLMLMLVYSFVMWIVVMLFLRSGCSVVLRWVFSVCVCFWNLLVCIILIMCSLIVVVSGLLLNVELCLFGWIILRILVFLIIVEMGRMLLLSVLFSRYRLGMMFFLLYVNVLFMWFSLVWILFVMNRMFFLL